MGKKENEKTFRRSERILERERRLATQQQKSQTKQQHQCQSSSGLGGKRAVCATTKTT
jgi:hypothetical protein